MSMNKRHYSDSSIRSNLHVIATPPTPTEVGLTRKQLALEVKLQQNSHDLLQLYQESQNWAAVSEIAQTLNTNSKRIEQLKHQLLSLENGNVVSHPPLLESISEADINPVSENSTTDHQLDSEPPPLPLHSSPVVVETGAKKREAQEDNRERESQDTTAQEEYKDPLEYNPCVEDKVRGGEEGGDLIHNPEQGTSFEKPLSYKDPQESPLVEPPSVVEEDTKHSSITSSSAVVPPKSVEVCPEEGELIVQETPDQPVLNESFEQKPVSDDTNNQPVKQDLLAQPDSDETHNQPILQDSSNNQEEPAEQCSQIDENLSSNSEVEDESRCVKQVIAEEELDLPLSQVQTPTEEEPTLSQEPLQQAPTDLEEHSDQSLTSTVAKSEQVEVPEVLEEPTFEESLDQIASFVNQIQSDLAVTEQSLGEIEDNPTQLESVNKNATDDTPLTEEEQLPLVQEEPSSEQVEFDSTGNPVALEESKEDSPEFKDAISNEEIERALSESSDDNSDTFFSPPESLEPSVSVEDIPIRSDLSHKEGSNPPEASVQDQPVSDAEAPSDLVAEVEKEEDPVVISNQGPCDTTVDATVIPNQDTEEEAAPDNQAPNRLDASNIPTETHTSVTDIHCVPTVDQPQEEEVEEALTISTPVSDQGSDDLCDISHLDPSLSVSSLKEEDTPVDTVPNNPPTANSTEPPLPDPPSEKEETPVLETGKGSKNCKMNDRGEIAFTVNKFTSPDDCSIFYRIDVRSYDVIFADPELLQHLPVLHSLEDFLKLRERLASILSEREDFQLPELIPHQNHHKDSAADDIRNGDGAEEDSREFEEFLSQVVNHPKLGREGVLADFLAGKDPSLSPLPDTQAETPQVTMNGVETTASEDDSNLPALDTQPDLDENHDISSPPTTTAEQTQDDNPTLSQSHSEEDTPLVKTDNHQQTPPTAAAQEDVTFSPNHSERTSSSATNSSSTVATDESAPEFQSHSQNRKEKLKLTRSESNPILGDYDISLESGDTLHQSLVPSQFKYASSDNILETSVLDIREEGAGSKSRIVAKRSTMKDRLKKRGKRIVRSVSTKGKRRAATVRDPSGEGGSVTIRRPITSQEWDPTCLLEELYSDYKQVATASDVSGESARHFGYLEKLPTRQSKATMLKGWKRRYFRAQEGNIYYYEDRTQEKALGFIRLSTARIVLIPERNQIQIVEKTGKNSIMLKAPDGDELLAWHRALELEAVHPTQTAPLSPLFKIENPILIIDIGACSVRAGLSREDAYPEIFFPAVCSLDARTLEILDCGYNALLPQNRYGAHQIYPRKTSLRMDKHDTNLKTKAIDGIVSAILEKMDIDPQSTQVLLTHPPTLPEQDCNDLAELLLDAFMFEGVCFQEQALLALYSYNTTSGIVVDIGDHIDVVPFIDGYKIEAGVSRMLFGGNAVTENLSKLITAKGIRYFSETEVYINRLVKESLCYVSQSFEENSAQCDASPAEYTRAVDVDRFRLPDHRKVIALDGALFRAPEGFFKPNLWGKDVPGLHDLVWKAIQACPIDQRREMAKKIYLSGGTTLIPGLQERLQTEVANLSPGGLTIEVHASPSRQHAAYLGGSVLAGLSSFQSYLVSQEEWNLEGVEALKKWGGT